MLDKEEFKKIMKREKSLPNKSVKQEKPAQKPGKYI